MVSGDVEGLSDGGTSGAPASNASNEAAERPSLIPLHGAAGPWVMPRPWQQPGMHGSPTAERVLPYLPLRTDLVPGAGEGWRVQRVVQAVLGCPTVRLRAFTRRCW